MKLTVFYDRKDTEFFLSFSHVAREHFIDYTVCAVPLSWKPGSPGDLQGKIAAAKSILIVTSSRVCSSAWLSYILGYAGGADLGIHLYFTGGFKCPHLSRFSHSESIEELGKFYSVYSRQWIKEAMIGLARKTLEDKGLDVTVSAFVEVVREGDLQLAGIYLDAGYKADEKDRFGVPVLCHAARVKKLYMVRLLLRAGADINAVSGDRNDTALIDAVSEDDPELVKMLLTYNPDLEVQSKNGQTALTIASGHNNVEIVRLLAEKGALKDSRDKLGMSAYSYAKLQGNEEIIAILEG